MALLEAEDEWTAGAFEGDLGEPSTSRFLEARSQTIADWYATLARGAKAAKRKRCDWGVPPTDAELAAEVCVLVEQFKESGTAIDGPLQHCPRRGGKWGTGRYLRDALAAAFGVDTMAKRARLTLQLDFIFDYRGSYGGPPSPWTRNGQTEPEPDPPPRPPPGPPCRFCSGRSGHAAGCKSEAISLAVKSALRMRQAANTIITPKQLHASLEQYPGDLSILKGVIKQAWDDFMYSEA